MKNKILAALCLLAACSPSKQSQIKQPFTPSNIVVTGKVFASLYQQQAAEYRALCFQAFNIAKLRVNESSFASKAKPMAIITDIDETVLDNSAYEVHRTLQGVDYESKSWYEWTDMSAADSVPGAPAFLKYAAAKGVSIFYVTNRDERERKGTLLNLQKFNLPNGDNEHLIMRQGKSSKEERRRAIENTYNVILYLGDNLADFSNLFDKKTLSERKQNTDEAADDFGKKFIIIPNPVYGDWEPVLYKYNYNFTPAQKDSVIRSILKNYH